MAAADAAADAKLIDIDRATLTISASIFARSSLPLARRIHSDLAIATDSVHDPVWASIVETHIEFTDTTLIVFPTSEGLQVIPESTPEVYQQLLYNSRTSYRKAVLEAAGVENYWDPDDDKAFEISDCESDSESDDEPSDDSDESSDESDDDESSDDSDDDESSDDSDDEPISKKHSLRRRTDRSAKRTRV